MREISEQSKVSSWCILVLYQMPCAFCFPRLVRSDLHNWRWNGGQKLVVENKWSTQRKRLTKTTAVSITVIQVAFTCIFSCCSLTFHYPQLVSYLTGLIWGPWGHALYHASALVEWDSPLFQTQPAGRQYLKSNLSLHSWKTFFFFSIPEGFWPSDRCANWPRAALLGCQLVKTNSDGEIQKMSSCPLQILSVTFFGRRRSRSFITANDGWCQKVDGYL